MNRAFEKILEFIDEQIKIEESIAKSENEGHPITHQYGANCMNVIKKFVQEVAEEFATDTNVGTNGWIPCSERLPEELKRIRAKKTCNKEKCDTKEICRICVVDDAIEIVKQGGLSNRKDCEYRHENGNCLKVGGFCTSVDDKHCEKIKQGGVFDDVCEWKSASDGEFIQNPHTKRLYSNEPSMQNVYCNTCGKKIKVVE